MLLVGPTALACEVALALDGACMHLAQPSLAQTSPHANFVASVPAL